MYRNTLHRFMPERLMKDLLRSELVFTKPPRSCSEVVVPVLRVPHQSHYAAISPRRLFLISVAQKTGEIITHLISKQ